MQVRVPVLVKDRQVAQFKDVPLTEQFTIEGEDVFLDGPVTRRVAVIDFEPTTGEIAPAAQFSPPRAAGTVGEYRYHDHPQLLDPQFMQVATFGGVYKTLQMFEEPDALGRRAAWAFAGPQLLVVPRAGDWANAFYDRDSRSIQLFHFTPSDRSERVYTCLSQDIIAHETAHAVIDGVVPDLFHAVSPQSLAIHEAVADLATLLMAFRSRRLAARVLEMTGGSLEHSTAFTAIATEFGAALAVRRHSLRELNNPFSMQSLDIDPNEPHSLSQVLSGALYSVMRTIYEDIRTPNKRAGSAPLRIARAEESAYHEAQEVQREVAASSAPAAAALRALFIAGERFKRTVIRTLDYLPPGEISFADFGRALLAADQASHPESHDQRAVLRQEFVIRGIVRNTSELEVRTNFDDPAVRRLDLEELVHSDWLAYQFVNNHRRLFNLPSRVPFVVQPRLDVTKKYYHDHHEQRFVRECLVKVAWTEVELNRVGGGLPVRRRITRGTTLAIDWESRQIRALISNDPGPSQLARDAFITTLLERDAIMIQASNAGGARRSVQAEIVDGALRLRGTARALHLL
jgi:hypothetical protein